MELYTNAEYPFWFSAQNRMRFACGISEVKMAGISVNPSSPRHCVGGHRGAVFGRASLAWQADANAILSCRKVGDQRACKARSQTFARVGIFGPGTIFRGAC